MPIATRRSGASIEYRKLRELGARSQPSFACLRDEELVVVQRFTRGADIERLHREARAVAASAHSNCARIRSIDVVGDDLLVASELVEGSTLEDLVILAGAKLLAHGVLARILVDVATGLWALASARDDDGFPLGLFHGELCPTNVVVGKDGITRIVNVVRSRPVKIGVLSEALGWAAPELLAADPLQDTRADVFAVGVMLWEGLAGRRLYESCDPEGVATKQRAGVEAPLSPGEPFAALGEVARRALSPDATARHRTPAELAAAIREACGDRIASPSAVARIVAELAGYRIRARRAELDPAASGMRVKQRSSNPPRPAAIATPEMATSFAPPAPVPSGFRSRPTPHEPIAVQRVDRRDDVLAPYSEEPTPVRSGLELHAPLPDLPGPRASATDIEVGGEEDFPGPRASGPEFVVGPEVEAAILAMRARVHLEEEPPPGSVKAIAPPASSLAPAVPIPRMAPPRMTTEAREFVPQMPRVVAEGKSLAERVTTWIVAVALVLSLLAIGAAFALRFLG